MKPERFLITNLASEIRYSLFLSRCYLTLLDLLSWPSHFISLSLSFLTLKASVNIVVIKIKCVRT